MIGLPRGVEVFMYDAPCDMRRSFNTLSVMVTGEMKRDLTTGDLFLFVSKNRKRAKVLYFDGTDFCLFAKRTKAAIQFPAPWKMTRNELSRSEFSLFIEGASAVRKSLNSAFLRKVNVKVNLS